jgi:hypothetical protein
MGSALRAGGEAVFCYAPATHRLDESAAGYSLAGCSPAEPASASPADTIFIPSAESVNRHRHRGGGFFDQQNAEFSIGIDTRPHLAPFQGFSGHLSANFRRFSGVIKSDIAQSKRVRSINNTPPPPYIF